MQLTIIIWTLTCAVTIIAYPLFLYHKSYSKRFRSKNEDEKVILKSIELFSFDLKDRELGWSFTIEIPELTEEILLEDTILFYLETEETCLKLPVNNETLGYTANIFKNIGKVYLTFKCVKDGVSNYNAPLCHLRSLKVLIIKPESLYPKSNAIYNYKNYTINNVLKVAGINIHDYVETLEYLSNLCEINFRGFRKNCVSSASRKLLVSNRSESKPQFSTMLV